jgi:hypothetical protein
MKGMDEEGLQRGRMVWMRRGIERMKGMDEEGL